MIQFFYMKKPIPLSILYFYQFYIQSSRTHLGHFQLAVSVFLEKSKTVIQLPVFVRKSVIFMEEGEYSFSLMSLLGDLFTQWLFPDCSCPPALRKEVTAAPTPLVLPEAVGLAGVARVCHPFPWCHSQGWSSERLGNGEPSSGQGQPRHPWDPTQPAKSYWKNIFTQLLHIWKLLRVRACLTSSFCPLSKAEIQNFALILGISIVCISFC